LVIGHDVKEGGFLFWIYVLNVDIKVVALIRLLRDQQVTPLFIDKLQHRILVIGFCKLWAIQPRVQPLQHAARKHTHLDVWRCYLLRWGKAFDGVNLARNDGLQRGGSRLVSKRTAETAETVSGDIVLAWGVFGVEYSLLIGLP